MSQMGSLSKMMGMFPGLPPEIAQLQETEGPKMMKKFLCIMDSMTDQELDSDGTIFIDQPSRILRVARGSGARIEEVEMMLVQSNKMSGMVKTMGGGKAAMKAMQKNGGKPPNPQDMMKQMMGGAGGGGFPGFGGGMPSMAQAQQMLSQMPGGMEGMRRMMAGMGMGGGGGMPSMEQMQKMYQNMMGGGAMPAGMPGMPGKRVKVKTIRARK
jgi:signal recognition particle subunit SRP54